MVRRRGAGLCVCREGGPLTAKCLSPYWARRYSRLHLPGERHTALVKRVCVCMFVCLRVCVCVCVCVVSV